MVVQPVVALSRMRTVHRRASGLGPMPDLIAFAEIRRNHACVTDEERQNKIISWIEPDERGTVHCLDEQDLNEEVLDCTVQVGGLCDRNAVTRSLP